MTDASIWLASNWMCWESNYSKMIFTLIVSYGCSPPLYLFILKCCMIYLEIRIPSISLVYFATGVSSFSFLFFLAGSSIGANLEEPDHVWILSWAWCVRHQRPLSAGKLHPFSILSLLSFIQEQSNMSISILTKYTLLEFFEVFKWSLILVEHSNALLSGLPVVDFEF